jgi:hypothetical protein
VLPGPFATVDIRACPRCASQDMNMATLSDGLWPGGETLRYVCRACDYQGMPLLFAERADYESFRESIRGPPGQERGARAAAELSDAAGQATWNAAERRPPIAVRDQRPLADRLHVAPLLVAVFGGLFALAGLSALLFARDPVSAGVLLLIGFALVVAGARTWAKRA